MVNLSLKSISRPSFVEFHSFLTVVLLIFLHCEMINAQAVEVADSSSVFQKRMTGLAVGGTVLAGGSLFILNEMWYSDFEREPFHFYRDGNHWLQMDKAGHFMSCYYLGSLGHDAMKWAGSGREKSIFIGGSIGLIYLTGIEVLDGFSSQWGFSAGDQLANAGGALFFMGQQLLWNEQRIAVRYNFLPTNYPQYRPKLLGDKLTEQWLKDYNGQVYWLSFNVHSFLAENSSFPRWLNLAVGYGADGMVSAMRNPPENLASGLPDFERQRQLYLSFDIDLSKIESESSLYKAFAKVFGFVKIPAPAIEFNQSGSTQFYWLR